MVCPLTLGDQETIKGLVLLNNHMSPLSTILIPLFNTHVYPVQTRYTALHEAAQEGHLRVVEMLVEANADVNIKTNVRYIQFIYMILDSINNAA